jgi:uncharacterized protein with beta-barrel porin domain
LRFSALFCLFSVYLFSGIAQGATLPTAFDLRNIDGRSYIGPVRNQEQCGSCWSFGTLAAAETTWNRTRGLYDDQTIDFSEAFMVWSLSPLYDGLHGCDGGNLELQQNTALIEYGVPLESDFPYTMTDPGEDLHWDATRYSFLDWYRIPPGDIETTRRVLYHIGAVTAGVLVEDDFYDYTGGIYTNGTTAITSKIPYNTAVNHLIALVGWNDDPGDGGLGYWILRNSWSDRWGLDGYMNIRYTTAGVTLHSSYMTLEPWDGASIALENNNDLTATPWSAGGTLNAHGVDLWGGAASSVANRGAILAEAYSADELATARGVYLWGGPEGAVSNAGTIVGLAGSENQQASAYAVCLQGGLVNNAGLLGAIAESYADQALAFGIWAANGGSAAEITNSGEIIAWAHESAMNAAYGIWADSRSLIKVTNTGSIEAYADDYAIGVLLTGGPALLQNSGTIRGSYASVYALQNTLMVLGTGSDLFGRVFLKGDEDTLVLTGNGTEDTAFYDVETLLMAGNDWSLSGDSTFDTIEIALGRLGMDGNLTGETSILEDGILGGNGSLTGMVTNSGTVAPGHSVGHLTIAGDFIQTSGGTLEIEIGDGIGDLLTVSGTADLAGSLLVLPDGYASAGSYTFLEAGTIAGAFDNLVSAAVFSVTLNDDTASTLSLDLARNSYLSLAAPHNRGLADTLDDLRPTADSDFGALLDRLDLALSRQALNDGLAALTPRIHGLASTVLIGDAQERLAGLRRHLQQIDPAMLLEGNPSGKISAWFDILGQYNRYGSDGGYFGARENLYGLLLGVERTTAKGLTLGVAASVSECRLEARDSDDDSEIETRQGYLYAAWRDPRRVGGLHLNAAMGGGLSQLDSERVIPFAGRKTRSEHDGTLLGATIGGGYAVAAGGWIFDPTVGLSFVHLREESFCESGADSADLKIAARDNDSLQSLLGLRLRRPIQLTAFSLEPELRLEWRHEFNRKTESLRARLAGGGTFATPGRDLAGDGVRLGASVKTILGDSVSGMLDYDCDLQSHGATGHALRLQLAVAF